MSAVSGKVRKKKKLKFGYFLLAVVLVILLGLAVFVYAQWHNIKAIYGAATSSPEKIVQQQKKNEEKTQDILSGMTDMNITELPEEMREKLKSGELSDEDAISIILGEKEVQPNGELTGSVGEAENSAEASAPVNAPTTNGNPAESVEKKEEQSAPAKKVGRKEEIIAEIYLLRAEYLNKIDALIASGKKTVADMPGKELSLSQKMSIINTYKEKGTALEENCDSRMEGLLSELGEELKKSGEDTAIISEIRSVYKEQKHLKKEELLNTYYPK